MAAYWDTSCILKLYCREQGSTACLARAASMTEPVMTSVFTVSEMTYAFFQKEMRGEVAPGSPGILLEQFDADIRSGRFVLLPFGGDVEDAARRLAVLCYSSSPAVALRTLDGLHLAAAQLAGCREILSTDLRMRSAAALIGLKTPEF